MRQVFLGALAALMIVGFQLGAPSPASAITASGPKITQVSPRCVRIATAGVDHGKATAQKYADDLLKGDIEKFKQSKGLKRVRVSNRWKKCKYHLWFFGDEYNCTSLAKVCW